MRRRTRSRYPRRSISPGASAAWSRGLRAPDRSGFTIIELLIALLLSGIVVGSIFQVIVGEGHFVELQSAREEVQQNARAALDLIGSELRTLPDGDALVVAKQDEITFRAARIVGVVCGGGGAELDVAFSSVPGANWAVNDGTGVMINLGTATAPVWSNAVAITSIGAAASDCNGVPLASGIEARRLSLASPPQNGSTTPAVGNVLYLYDEISYRSGTSASVPGRWIQRRIGGGTNQPMAGPIVDGDGLRFEYFAGTSSTPLSTPINDAATRASVSKIVVTVETESRNSPGGVQETKADTIVIALRNRL